MARRLARNSQWGGCVWGSPLAAGDEWDLRAKPPAAGGWGFGGKPPAAGGTGAGEEPPALENFAFFAKLT